MPIQILPPLLVSRIAAGEVVERPASVVKELVENALDAGAARIRVAIDEGGVRRIQVEDDGCGIPEAEVELAFERHATSKLSRLEDLQALSTLGFRGEALPAISAAANVTLVTRAAGEAAGTWLRLEAGRRQERRRQGAPPGTTLSVEHLFHATPARRKFMRSPATEAGHAADVVSRYALAYPAVAFALEVDGRERFRAPGTGEMLDVLREVYGVDVAAHLVGVERRAGGLRVWGYASPPGLHRASGRAITLLVNGRWVTDRSLAYAVTQAYHALLPGGRYPLAVVALQLPPELVDVNVHPTKREVRFQRPNEVFALVQSALRAALTREAPYRVAGWERPSDGAGQMRYERLEAVRQAGLALREEEAAAAPPERSLPPLRVLGQIALTYIVAEGPEGLYLIDQHAAHERILYEKLWDGRQGSPARQDLLEPLLFEATPSEAERLAEALPLLGGMGFQIEAFGRQAFRIQTLPAGLAPSRADEALRAFLAEVSAEVAGGAAWRERATVSLICHTAVRAGQALRQPEMEALLGELERCRLPYSCPHGRATVLEIGAADLARKFGRA